MHYTRWRRNGDPLIRGKQVLTECVVCGTVTLGNSRRLTCSAGCMRAKSEAERQGLPIPEYVPAAALRDRESPVSVVDRSCLEDGCDKPVKARGYCSTHHQYRYTHGTLQSRFCRGCGAVLGDDVSLGRRYCSDDCRPSGIVYPEYWKPCERCGLPIDMTIKGSDGRRRRADVKMCDYCRKVRHRRHRTSLGLIIQRDGTICQICGEHVSLDLKAPNPASPSVDHIVPFSLGGSHDLENLQLAHLGCNMHKNNKVS